MPPKGGPRDKTPPQPKQYIPPNKSINFKSPLIEIEFNEFIKTQKTQTNTYISPPLPEPPKVSSHKKTLSIELPDSLKKNTTYTIQLKDVVKDITEGNTAKSIEYIFSTGPHIDTNSIQGHMVKLPSLSYEEGWYILLHKRQSDSVIYNAKPTYYGITNKSGHYKIKNIKTGNYDLYGLKDENDNLRYDLPGESIAFLDSTITINDTSGFYNLNLFKEANRPQKIIKVSSEWPGKVVFYFNKPVHDLSINRLYPPMPAQKRGWIDKKEGTDTIPYWNPEKNTDSLVFKVETSNYKDTVYSQILAPSAKRKKTLKKLRFTDNTGQDNTLNPEDNLVLKANHPLSDKQKLPISLFKDSILVDSNVQIIANKGSRQIVIDHSWKGGEKYNLKILPRTIFDIYGFTQDSLSLTFNTYSKGEFGSLTVKATDSTVRDQQYLVRLYEGKIKSNDNYIEQLTFSTDTSYKLEDIHKGEYKVRVIKDRNNNNQWNTGDYSKQRQPEKIITYSGTITIKSQWTTSITLRELLPNNRHNEGKTR